MCRRQGCDVGSAALRSGGDEQHSERAGARSFPCRTPALRKLDSRGAARVLAKTRGAERGRAEIQSPGGRIAATGEFADLTRIRWEENRAIPRCVAALLAGQANRLPHLTSDAEWKAALHYFDRNQFTLMLPRTGLPD